jgi:hypothetical protein
MNSSNDHLDLVRDALYAREMKYVGCFAFNKTSERLQEIGSTVLPTLELVLREEVMPDCPSDPKDQIQEFPGMDSLLVTYFRIVSNGQMTRATDFLSSLHGPVFVEAIRAISIVWDHAIPDSLLPAIEAAARTGSPEERSIATWALDWHQSKCQATPA